MSSGRSPIAQAVEPGTVRNPYPADGYGWLDGGVLLLPYTAAADEIRVHEAVTRPERLAEIEAADLADAASEEPFDRITRLAERLLDVPVALVTIVSGDRQIFKSQVGLSGASAAERESPLEYSFCKYAVADESRFVVGDSRTHPRVMNNPSVKLGVVAYAGEPLRTSRGHVLGTVCVIDHKPRQWQDSELELLAELASIAVSEIEYRLRARALREVETSARALQEPLTELGNTVRSMAALAESVDDHRLGRLASLARSRFGSVEVVANELAETLAAESGRRSGVYVQVLLGQPMFRAARVAMASIPEKSITVDLRDRPLRVVCDAYEMERGLTEILLVLMQHVESGGAVALTASRDGDTARIAVESSGTAIPVAELGRIAARLQESTRGPDDDEVVSPSITTCGGVITVRHGGVEALTRDGRTSVVAHLPLVDTAVEE